MTPTKGPHVPEREGAPVVDDPALVAAKKAQEAAAAWSAISKTCRTPDDENTPEFKAAQERSEKADDAFADAPVISAAGALVKMREIAEMSMTGQYDDTSLDGRHFKTVVAFLEGLAGAPSVVADDHPDAALLALWQEYVELLDRWNASPGTSDREGNAFLDHASRIECQICDTTPHTPAGLVVLVKLLAHYQEGDPTFTDQRDAALARNILAALEQLTPGLADVERGSRAAESDPVVTLFAEWGAIQDKVTAHSAAISKDAGSEAEKLWDEAIDRRDVVGDKIMETPATSIKGVAVKVRLASHYAFDVVELAPLYGTPSRDIDYDVEGGAGGALNDYLVSALRDAERLAGVS